MNEYRKADGTLDIAKISSMFATEEQRKADKQLREEEHQAICNLDAEFVNKYGESTNDNPWTNEQLAEYAAATKALNEEYRKRFAAIHP